MKKAIIYAACLLLFGAVTSAQASGKLFARIPNWENSPVYDLQLKTFEVTANIQDQLAVVHLDETFYNDQTRVLEGVYFLELPEGSKVTELALWIDGKRVEHEIKRREDAVQEYEEIVRRSTDPLLAEQAGENTFRLRLFPLPPKGERRIEVTYIQPLPAVGNKVDFLFPLRLENYRASASEEGLIHVELKTQTAIEVVTPGPNVPEGKTSTERVTERFYRIEFEDSGTVFDYDFTLLYELAEKPVFTPLGFTGPTSSDGYFLLWAQPPASFFPDSMVARQVVFCIDVSASIIGYKLEQVKSGLLAVLQNLREQDSFNLVIFNTEVVSFRSNLVSATSTNKAEAAQYIGTLSATGLTNMSGALQTALAMFSEQTARPQIILISDGEPTAGETGKDRILSSVASANNHGAGIFPVGIANEIDHSFLNELAQQNGGQAFFINDGEPLHELLVQLDEKIATPLLTSVEIEQIGVTAYDLLPAVLPNLGKDSQAMQLGRFVQPGAGELVLRANNGRETVTANSAIDWLNVPQSEFVSRLWAAHKIAALQQEIDRFGEQSELVDAIVSLSIDYSVLSEYTAFIVIEPGADITAIDDEQPAVPETFTLHQNYPNPFNPETTIRFELSQSGRCDGCPVRLEIYNIRGELVRVLVNEARQPGVYTVVWDGRDDAGRQVTSGVYIYKLKIGEMETSKRMLLLR